LRAPGVELWLCVGVRSPYDALVPYSKYQLVEWPRESTAPVSVAPDDVVFETAPVRTPGAPFVVNVTSLPVFVPVGFEATSRTWYVVPAASPVSPFEIDTVLRPEPTSFALVFEP
jgi:hypothetical protein